MIETDPGHKYFVENYDGKDDDLLYQRLVFVKREGLKYPGNVGSYPGTNCQEVLRVLIARIKYLDSQVPCLENEETLGDLRRALLRFEVRAARRHNRLDEFMKAIDVSRIDIEDWPTCEGCGHIICYKEAEGCGQEAGKRKAAILNEPSVKS